MRPRRSPGSPATCSMTRCAPGSSPTSRSVVAASSPASTWRPSSPRPHRDPSTPRPVRPRAYPQPPSLRHSAAAKTGKVPVPGPIRRVSMKRLTAVGDRFGQARGLAPLLDAACNAFEEILEVIGDYEDASDGAAMLLLLAATQAATAVTPSCSRRLCLPAVFTSRSRWGRSRGSAQDIASAVARLGRLLAARLAHSADTAAEAADRAACQDAARYAQQIHALLAGDSP